jgi:hypothetical protein
MDPGITHAGAPTSDQATLPIFRALLAIQVLAAAVFGLWPFVAPEAFAALGGLRGTEPFIYRLAGAATLGYGVAALFALGRPSWERVRIPIAATTAFNAAAVLAMFLSIADGETPWIVWLILAAASVFTLLGGYWLIRNQGPAEERPHPVGGRFRLVLGVATLAATIFGVVPLLAAEAAASLAGFDTAELFPYRMAGAATLGYAVAGVLQLRERAAGAVRLQVVAALVFNACSALAVALYLLGGDSAPVAILIGAAATAFSVAFAAWLLQVRSNTSTEVATS